MADHTGTWRQESSTAIIGTAGHCNCNKTEVYLEATWDRHSKAQLTECAS